MPCSQCATLIEQLFSALHHREHDAELVFASKAVQRLERQIKDHQTTHSEEKI